MSEEENRAQNSATELDIDKSPDIEPTESNNSELHAEIENLDVDTHSDRESGRYEHTSSTVMAVKTRRDRKPTIKDKQNRANQLKTDISTLINHRLKSYEQSLSAIDKENYELAENLEYLEQSGQEVDALCNELTKRSVQW